MAPDGALTGFRPHQRAFRWKRQHRDLVEMPYRFGKATAGFGWLLLLVGVGYLALGFRGALGGIPGSLPRMLLIRALAAS